MNNILNIFPDPPSKVKIFCSDFEQLWIPENRWILEITCLKGINIFQNCGIKYLYIWNRNFHHCSIIVNNSSSPIYCTNLREFILLYYFFSFFLSEWRVSDLENLFLVTLRRRRIELEAGFITVFIVGSHHLRLRPASCLYISRVGVRILVYSSFNCARKRRRRRRNVMQ